MILITSATYVSPALISEFGKLPPCMLPVQNKRLYEHQLNLTTGREEKIFLSLPQSYKLSIYDKKKLDKYDVSIIYVPDNFSLGQSVVYVLNVIARYNEPLYLLHGDTLFSKLSFEKNICASYLTAEDYYNWATINHSNEGPIYAGYFTFSSQSLLIQKITENNYNFIKGVEIYGEKQKLKYITLPDWMDFSLINSYYRNISKLTTQRIFNSLKVTRYSVLKNSKDKLKMRAEANWIMQIPKEMKHYVPSLWDFGEKDDYGFYEIEYFFLSSLSNLYVFGKNSIYIWKEIINACIEYINIECKYKPSNTLEVAKQNDKLYSTKTIARLEEYAQETGVSLSQAWKINGISTPSINEIISEIEPLISKEDKRFTTMMHGDFCFSNILYDFKSKTIKVIDPRGIDINGNLSIYGDLRYDVAKLAHSILGMYDFIIGDKFNYHEINKYNIEFGFEEDANISKIQEYFKAQIFGGFNIEELSTYPILIHLFLSMLPLHNDNISRQKAMLANALKLYTELKKTK